MAQIVFLGNFNVSYTSESHHASSLESLGHRVIRLQEGVERSEIILKTALRADLFVWVHTHGWKTPGRYAMDQVLRELKDAGKPTMTYHLDLWFGLERQRDLEQDNFYKTIGHFFTVDSLMADWFNSKTEVKGHYLSAGVFGDECTYTPTKPERDVIFVGSKSYHPEWEYRPKLINFLEESYPKNFTLYGREGVKSVRGQELNDLYASTKVVVGDTLCPDFNYPIFWSDRIYETLGRGGFLIHPYIKGLDREFKDKKHVVFYEYGNLKQLKELIDYYLENDKEREEIRKAGHEFVKNNYTYKHRWETILKELGI